MAITFEDPNHLQIIEWIIGLMVIIGGSMSAIIAKMIKGKTNKVECDLIHQALTSRLDDIKGKLEKGDIKMDSMDKTLVEISTTLKIRSADETERYTRHSEEWKDK